MLQDPVKVRRRSVYAAILMVGVHAIASDGLDDRIPGLAYAVTWLAAPLLALTYGYGSAFFVQHGVGVRKSMVQLIAGSLVLVATCVALAAIADSGYATSGRIIVAVLNGGLFGAAIMALGAGVALGLGRGPDYVGKRVQSLDDDDVW